MNVANIVRHSRKVSSNFSIPEKVRTHTAIPDSISHSDQAEAIGIGVTPLIALIDAHEERMIMRSQYHIPETVKQLEKAGVRLEEEGVSKETTMVGLSERAARPLIKEKKPEIEDKAISTVASRLKREIDSYLKLVSAHENAQISNPSIS